MGLALLFGGRAARFRLRRRRALSGGAVLLLPFLPQPDARSAHGRCKMVCACARCRGRDRRPRQRQRARPSAGPSPLAKRLRFRCAPFSSNHFPQLPLGHRAGTHFIGSVFVFVYDRATSSATPPPALPALSPALPITIRPPRPLYSPPTRLPEPDVGLTLRLGRSSPSDHHGRD